MLLDWTVFATRLVLFTTRFGRISYTIGWYLLHTWVVLVIVDVCVVNFVALISVVLWSPPGSARSSRPSRTPPQATKLTTQEEEERGGLV